MSINAKDVATFERTVHFSSTGQYLKPLFQDKDNGNNRFITTIYSSPISDLDLSNAKTSNLYEKKDPTGQNKKKETYISLMIPVKGDKIKYHETIEFQDKTYKKDKSGKTIDIYTTNEDEAAQVLSLLKTLHSII